MQETSNLIPTRTHTHTHTEQKTEKERKFHSQEVGANIDKLVCSIISYARRNYNWFRCMIFHINHPSVLAQQIDFNLYLAYTLYLIPFWRMKHSIDYNRHNYIQQN